MVIEDFIQRLDMKLKLIVENYKDGFSFSLKDGRKASVTVDEYKYVRSPQHAAYEILVSVDGKRIGYFTLGIYKEDGRLVAQMDSKVKKPFRRQGIASAIYSFADTIASKYNTTIQQAPDSSDDAKKFWNTRP